MMLPEIIAKALALVNALLDYWTDEGAAVTANYGTCFTFTIQNITLNDCGNLLLGNLAELINGIVFLVPDVLGGLFAYSY